MRPSPSLSVFVICASLVAAGGCSSKVVQESPGGGGASQLGGGGSTSHSGEPGTSTLPSESTTAVTSTSGGFGGTGEGGSFTTTTTTDLVTWTTSSGTTTVTWTGPTSGIGATCVTDGECGVGSFCIGAGASDPVLGGGVLFGYCSKGCESPFDCPNDSTCVVDSVTAPTVGRCMLTCDFGADDSEKCAARKELRCVPLKVDGAASVCYPNCMSDELCAVDSGDPEMKCDMRTGACTKTPSVGDPIGADCTPPEAGSTESNCAGVCLSLGTGPQANMCSAPCTLQGYVDNCNGQGFCSFAATIGTGAVMTSSAQGDNAYCSPNCSSHAECAALGLWCFQPSSWETNDPVVPPTCLPATPCATQADCKEASGLEAPVYDQTCTQTASGKFCLDPDFTTG